MEIIVKLLAIVYGLVFFWGFIIMVKNKAVKPFYSFLWLVVCLFMFSFIVFEKQYQWLANVLQIQNATFLVIVGLISFLMLYVLYLSIRISEMSNRIQEILSQGSILEHEIRKIKDLNIERKEQ